MEYCVACGCPFPHESLLTRECFDPKWYERSEEDEELIELRWLSQCMIILEGECPRSEVERFWTQLEDFRAGRSLVNPWKEEEFSKDMEDKHATKRRKVEINLDEKEDRDGAPIFPASKLFRCGEYVEVRATRAHLFSFPPPPFLCRLSMATCYRQKIGNHMLVEGHTATFSSMRHAGCIWVCPYIMILFKVWENFSTKIHFQLPIPPPNQIL